MPNLDPWRSRYRRWNCRCLCQTEWHLQRHFCGACQGAGTFLKGNCWQKLKLNVTSWIPPDIGRQTEKVDSALLPSTSANSNHFIPNAVYLDAPPCSLIHPLSLRSFDLWQVYLWWDCSSWMIGSALQGSGTLHTRWSSPHGQSAPRNGGLLQSECPH